MKKVLQMVSDPQARRSLGLSVVEAALWSVMFALAENYIVPFALLFGASALQIALIQGSGQLMVASGQLFGAVVIRRLKRRKPWILFSMSLHAGSWLFVLAGAYLTGNPWVILAAFAFGLFSTNMAGPAWISWMNELVPREIRGRYWGNRNRISGVVQFFGIITAGFILSRFPEKPEILWVFGIFFIVAFFFRALGMVPMSLQTENRQESEESIEDSTDTLKGFAKDLLTTSFGRFVLFNSSMIFAAALMGPSIPLYLLKSLGLGYFSYTIVMMTSMVLTFLAMNYWGPLSDRFGNYRILAVTGAALPIIGIGWAFARTLPVLIAVQALAGFSWAGFNLASTNFIFDSQPARKTGRTMAYFAALSNIFAFSGSLVSGVLCSIVVNWDIPLLKDGNYETIFILSGILRLLVYLIFIRKFTEVRPVEESPGKRFFFFQQPAILFFSRMEFYATYIRKQFKPGKEPDSEE